MAAKDRKKATPSARAKLRKARAKPAASASGVSGLLLVDEWGGGDHEQVRHVVRIGEKPHKPTPPKRIPAVAGRRRFRAAPGTCRAFAAAGHPTRAKLLAKLLEGPATYRALQKATKLAAGPLYHHINQLRLAGLILPKQRDLYELTRGGRNLLVVMATVEPLLQDKRRRAVGG